jgi:hypothetical protein
LLLDVELEYENELETRMGKRRENGDHWLGKDGDSDEESRVSKLVAPI